MKRRQFLQHTGGSLVAALAAAGGWPQAALAEEWNRAAFEAKSIEEVLKALGATNATESGDILINAPEIAENGAVVPIGVSSRLPATERIAVMIEKNPNLLAAVFAIPEGTPSEIQTRIKMAQTSNVVVLAKAGGRHAFALKEIKITLGGCGG